MQHHFDIYIAEQYGILEAILLNHFEFWIAKNEANETNYYDGDYWTYNSTKALQKLFPYVSQRKIQNALKHLIDEGVLMTGNYNKSAYDRTLWYAFTEKGKCIMQKCKMEDANLSNQLCNNVQPIPDNNTYNDKDNNIYCRVNEELNNEDCHTIINKSQNQQVENPTSTEQDVNALREYIKCLKKEIEMLKEENGNENKIEHKGLYSAIVDELNNVCGTHYKASTKTTRDLIDARIKEGFTENDFFTVIAKKASTWKGTKMEQYLRPQTLFGTKFESYLNEKISSGNPFMDILKGVAQ